VITLPGGHGSVRCLHWVTGKPLNIAADQVRYSLDDHLGSCALELDQQAQVISQEGYYPFGATAWYARGSEVDADYKTIRYSGKEMDDSGLYYYGARYYAPWLQRWVSADPAGGVDGLNLYAFVGNNPLRYIDDTGETKKPSELRNTIVDNLKYLSGVNRNVKDMDKQMDDLSRPLSYRLKVLKSFVYLSGRAVAGFFSAYFVTGNAFATSSVPGELQGLTLGNFTADTSNSAYASAMSPLGLNAPIVPRLSDLAPESIRQQSAGQSNGPLDSFNVQPTTWSERAENIRALGNMIRDNVGGALLPGVSELAELYTVAKDANKAEEGLLDVELDAYESALGTLRESVIKASEVSNAAFEALGVEQFYADFSDHMYDIARGRVGADNSRMVSRSTQQRFTERALYGIDEAKLTLGRYRSHAARKTAQRAA
jgi:insecticidal toxin complex protein TccC